MIKINEDNTQIIFSGVTKSAYKRKDTDKNGNAADDAAVKNVITVYPDDVKEVFGAITAYVNSGKNYTPEWFKGGEYIKLKSVYDIPFKTSAGDVITFDEFLDRGLIKGGKVVVRFIQKDGAIYPAAVKEVEPGEAYDPFEDM